MRVFITTCSMNKAAGGTPYERYGWHNERRRDLLELRLEVLRMMKVGELRSSTTLPVEGPDFLGTTSLGKYLPAIRRYREGAFVQGLTASKVSLREWGMRNRLYFLSALYGIVHYREPIQSYDLPLTDPRLARKWKKAKIITKAILADINAMHKNCEIIDCTGDSSYSELIDWKTLEAADFPIQHVLMVGETTDRQTRWTAGYLAGLPVDSHSALFSHGGRYSSNNGSVLIGSDAHAVSAPTSSPANKKPTIAVAFQNDSQYASFRKYTNDQRWGDWVDVEPVKDLRPETIKRLDQNGVKLLVVHVDGTHSQIRRTYQIRSGDINCNLPKDWKWKAIKNERNSDIQLELKVGFKIS